MVSCLGGRVPDLGLAQQSNDLKLIGCKSHACLWAGRIAKSNLTTYKDHEASLRVGGQWLTSPDSSPKSPSLMVSHLPRSCSFQAHGYKAKAVACLWQPLSRPDRERRSAVGNG